MPDFSDPLLDTGRRTNWVRLRTLIVLRWIAAAGQLGAIVAAVEWFGVHLWLGPAIAVVALLWVRLNQPVLPELPDAITLPQDAQTRAVTFATDRIVVLTTDDRVLVYDRAGTLMGHTELQP